MRRNSPRLLAINAIIAARSYWFFVLLALAIRHQVHDGWSTAVTALFWYYTYTRIYVVFYGWVSQRYHIGADSLTVRNGLIQTASSTLPFDAPTQVRISQTLLHRVFRCSVVEIGLEGSSTVFQLKGVPTRVAHEIAVRFTVPLTAQDDQLGDTAPTASSRETVYTIAPRDFVLISVTYGQMFLFLPFLVETCNQVSERFHTPSIRQIYDSGAHISLPHAIMALVLTVGAAIVYGVVISWVKYHGFELSDGKGVWTTRRGLLATRRENVEHSAIAGYRLKQNLLMRASGYVRVDCLTTDVNARSGRNILLPCVRLPEALELLRRTSPGMSTNQINGRHPHPRIVVGQYLALMATSLAVIRVSFWWSPPPSWSTYFARAGLVLTGILTAWLANRCWAVAYLDAPDPTAPTRERPRHIVLVRGMLTRDCYLLRHQDLIRVYAVSTPVTRLARTCHVFVFFRDGGTRRFQLAWVPLAHAVALLQTATSHPISTSLHRRAVHHPQTPTSPPIATPTAGLVTDTTSSAPAAAAPVPGNRAMAARSCTPS